MSAEELAKADQAEADAIDTLSKSVSRKKYMDTTTKNC